MSVTRGWRITYSDPSDLLLCGCCDRHLEAFSSPFLVPSPPFWIGSDRWALLCDPCARVWAEREAEAESSAAWFE